MRKPQAGRVINKVASSIATNNLSSAKDRLRKPAQTVHIRAQRSKTLMRSSLSKPGSTQQQAKSSAKSNLASTKSSRLASAINIAKNPKVKRFGQPINRTKSVLSNTRQRSKSQVKDLQAAKTAPARAMAVPTAPSIVGSVSHQRLERMLDEALLKADAHKKALVERSGKGRISKRIKWVPRWMAVSFVTVVLVIMGLYFAWQKVPYVSMKLASVRAQIRGSVPAYVPSGFKFAGPTQYASGEISMTYKAEEKSRYFTVIQKASNWDSSSLEANSVPKDAQVQTSQIKGTTVYYSDDQATWVTNGKRYIIKDHAQLNAGELFKIADSIL